jgi:CheY-like chemotaxis protein
MYQVFIIEDDEIVAEIYKSKLEAEGYEVRVAFSGEDGFESIRTLKPDLLLLDMMLPGLSGADLLMLLRARQEFRSLPIVAFTGSDSPEIIAEAEQLGATKVLSKGAYSPGEIVARITEILAALPRNFQSDAILLQSISEWTPPAGRVLVVEDDAVVMALVKDVIEEEGYTVVTASDGREAYRILENDKNFAAGIFDVKMPFIQGPDLVRHMKSNKKMMKIPVLIMTAEQNPAVQSESFSAGAAMFIAKPFQRAVLRSMFRELITVGR